MTAMDSVSTMSPEMKKEMMKQMKKKDMMYGGKKMKFGGKKPTTAKQRISDIDKMMTGATSDSKKRLMKRKASLQKQMASNKKPMRYGGKKKPMTYGGKKMRYGGGKKALK